MRIGGLQKFSLIDYPGKVAAVIFTQGCDFRCPFCHNADLVLAEKFISPLNEEEVFNFLTHRQGQLAGVVVTGGEPCIHQDLPDFLRKIKTLGYCVKLDTNGHHPDVLKELIAKGLVDYIAMDVKAPFGRYDEASGVKVDIDKIRQSMDLIMGCGKDYHFRTTVVRKLLSSIDLEEIARSLHHAKKYLLQNFSAKSSLLDNTLKDARVYSDDEFAALQKRFEKKV